MPRAHRPNRPVQRPPANRTTVAVQKALRLPPIVNGYYATIDSPVNGISTPDRTPSLIVTGHSVALSPVDIQVEWRRVMPTRITPTSPWVPVATYVSEVLAATSGTPQNIVPPANLEYKTWWYVARAGNKSAGIWGQWTAPRYLDVRPVLGSIAQYIDINIGVTDPPIDGTWAYIDMNIGVDESLYEPTLTGYVDLNVGVEHLPLTSIVYSDMNVGIERLLLTAIQYSDMNVRTDLTPVPHIWWIRPEQGRWGYGFNIYGHGFGSFQGEFDGTVKLGDFTCQVVEWQRIPAVPPPDTIIRADDPADDIIKPEHGWIFVIVPQNSVSAMVKVVLDG